MPIGATCAKLFFNRINTCQVSNKNRNKHSARCHMIDAPGPVAKVACHGVRDGTRSSRPLPPVGRRPPRRWPAPAPPRPWPAAPSRRGWPARAHVQPARAQASPAQKRGCTSRRGSSSLPAPAVARASSTRWGQGRSADTQSEHALLPGPANIHGQNVSPKQGQGQR